KNCRSYGDGMSPGPIRDYLSLIARKHILSEQQLLFILILTNVFYQQISAPAGIFFSGTMRDNSPFSSSAQRIIPSDSTPASFAGFRFTRTITFLPTISSGV